MTLAILSVCLTVNYDGLLMPPRRTPQSLRTNAAQSSPVGQLPAHYIPGFLHHLRSECGLAENTLKAYSRDLNKFCDWYAHHGPASFQDLQVATFTSFLQSLQQRGLKPSSMARHLVSLKMFFRYLLLEGVVARSVVDLISSPKLWQHLPRVLSPEMVDELLQAPSWEDRWPLRDRALMAVMYATGCRASEVCQLQIQDVQLEAAFCRCRGKGNKERLVSLNPIACAALRDYLLKERPRLAGSSSEGPLFLTHRGRPMTRLTVWKLIKRYAARIGVSRQVSPHTLRHSFATHMLAGGAEIRALQELLGHASIRTTQIYTQVDHSRLKAIHEKCHPRG
ncbi:MAG: tyrosine recombinase XerC [Planctomycetaceae bacterium]|nr:MAG: tyrosine recombinase XerC [Planctomycetaceae bacterium]